MSMRESDVDHPGYRISELERIANNIFREGIVKEANYQEQRLRVQTEGILTNWIPWAKQRWYKDMSWWAPEVDEQVQIMSFSGDPSQGIVIFSLDRDMFPAKADKPTIYRQDFADGSYFRHDRETGETHVYAVGDLYLVGKNVRINPPDYVPIEFN